MQKQPDDPTRRLICRLDKGRVTFDLVFDAVEMHRYFEAYYAAQLPERADLQELTPAAELDPKKKQARRNVPVAGKLAREAILHFNAMALLTLEKAFDALLEVAAETAATAYADLATSVPPDTPVELSAGPIADPRSIRTRSDQTEARKNFLTKWKKIGQSVDFKRPGREAGHKDSAESPRAKRAAQANRETDAAQARRVAEAFGSDATESDGDLMFSPQSSARTDKAALHDDLARRKPTLFPTPAAAKRRRLRRSEKI